MATASVTNTFVASTPAEAAQVNTNFTDLVTFLNNSVVHVDGSKAMTGNFDAGSNKIVNLTTGTASGDAVNFGQLTAAGSSLPLGKMALSTKTTNASSATTSYVDITTATWTAVSGRLYKVSWLAGDLQQSTAAGIITVALRNGSTVLTSSEHDQESSGSTVASSGFATVTGSGSYTVKLSYKSTAGTVTAQGSSTAPIRLLVEDIGLA